jgi:hypothetical protein
LSKYLVSIGKAELLANSLESKVKNNEAFVENIKESADDADIKLYLI